MKGGPPHHPGAAGADGADAPDPGAPRRIEVTVRGHVQGVGYRWYVSRTAARLELVGWVANRRDGSVELVAEGVGSSLDALTAALWLGPAGAQVQAVDVRPGSAVGGLRGFEIRPGSHPGD